MTTEAELELSIQEIRELLFTPCETRGDLRRWLKFFLDIHLPDGRVDDDSNSSPFELLWEVYSACRTNKPTFSRLLTYASRAGYKTLTAAVIEVLMVTHLGRSVAHMAAVRSQASKAQSYVKTFFSRKHLSDFKGKDNDTNVEVIRYVGQDGSILTSKEYEALPETARVGYERKSNYIVIVICTLKGANSEHVPFFVVDEVDVIDNLGRRAYSQAKAIPDVVGGMRPLTLLISTRKFSFGLVQEEIDDAPKTGLQVRHWNCLDVAEKCPPERHLPLAPRIRIWRDDEDVKAISEEEYQDLPPEQQLRYVEDQGYTGCLQNCQLFAACRGRLATRSDSGSPMLKPVDHLQGLFRDAVELVQAEELCRKPTTQGLIYPRLSRERHVRTAAQLAEIITGEPVRQRHYGRQQLVDLFKTCRREQDDISRFGTGMDHGFSHFFAAVTGFKFGAYLLIFSSIAAKELELHQKISICAPLLDLNPDVWPDMANPDDNKTFRRSGFRVREWKKGPGSIKSGIEMVRAMLSPPVGNPTLLFLEGDPGVEALFAQLSKYHWKLDISEKPTDEPDKRDDDLCDALRYLAMNINTRRVLTTSTISVGPILDGTPTPQQPTPTVDNWMQQAIRESIGDAPEASSGGQIIRKGSLCFSIE